MKGKSEFWRYGKIATWVISSITLTVAVIAGVVAAGGVLQDNIAMRSENAAQATMIAIMARQGTVQSSQLQVQRTIAALAASGRTGPTATAMANEAVDWAVRLMSTWEALDVEKRAVAPTLTPAARRVSDSKVPSAPPRSPSATGPPPTSTPRSSSPLVRQASQVVGIDAELFEFFRFQNRITVKVRLINASEVRQYVAKPTEDSYALDETTGKKYPMTEQSNEGGVWVPATSSFPVWAKYEIPEEDEPQYLTVVLGEGILFDHLEVSYKKAE